MPSIPGEICQTWNQFGIWTGSVFRTNMKNKIHKNPTFTQLSFYNEEKTSVGYNTLLLSDSV